MQARNCRLGLSLGPCAQLEKQRLAPQTCGSERCQTQRPGLAAALRQHLARALSLTRP